MLTYLHGVRECENIIAEIQVRSQGLGLGVRGQGLGLGNTVIEMIQAEALTTTPTLNPQPPTPNPQPPTLDPRPPTPNPQP